MIKKCFIRSCLFLLLFPLMVLAGRYECPKCQSKSIAPYGGELTDTYSYHDHICKNCGHKFHVGDSTLAAGGDSIYVEGDHMDLPGRPEPPSTSCSADTIESPGSNLRGVGQARPRRICASGNPPPAVSLEDSLADELGGLSIGVSGSRRGLPDIVESAFGGGMESGVDVILGAPIVLRIKVHRPDCSASVLNQPPSETPCTELQQTALDYLEIFQGIVMSLLSQNSAGIDQDTGYFQGMLMSVNIEPVIAGEVPALARAGQLFAEVIQVPGGTANDERYLINLLLVENGRIHYYLSETQCWKIGDLDDFHLIVQRSQTMYERPVLFYKLPYGDE